MNAQTRMTVGTPLQGAVHSSDALFSGVEQVCEMLAGADDAPVALARILELLDHRHGLKCGRVALLRSNGRFDAIVAHGDNAAPEASPLAMRKLLASGAPTALRVAAITPAGRRKRGEKAWLLAAPIFAEGEPIGVLTVFPTSKVGDAHSADLLLIGLVANLVGQPLRAILGAAPAKKAPEPDRKAIVGQSEAINAALEAARRIARGNLPVFLRGESGSGKELFAQFVHDRSPRAKKPFIKVNCASLSESILESELFGHERGAFTGAETQRKGRFELADSGTLLLDEIRDISPAFQLKLLRVLQEGEFERVGGDRTITVDVRIIAATHSDIEAAVRRRAFRADLYYRLAVTSVRVPTLRERREDIPLIARHILSRFNVENDRNLYLHPGAEELLCKCAFPGNVRELENCVRAAATMARNEEVVERDFACRSRSCFSSRLRRAFAVAKEVRRQSLTAL
jgi:Nif-specific regulatory protein